MITFIPFFVRSSPKGPDNKCPKCGHEWDNESSLLFFFLFIISFILLIWVILTLIMWLSGTPLDCGGVYNYGTCGNASLAEIIQMQFKWFMSLKVL